MKRLSGSRNQTGIIGLSQAAAAAKGNILKTFNEQFGNIPWADGDRVHKLITEDIPEKVAADTAYQNAKQNAD